MSTTAGPVPASQPDRSPECTLAIAATGRVACPLEEVADLAANLRLPNGEPIPSSALKVSDQQTIVGMAAVLEAIDRGGLHSTDMSDWGIVGAPRFLGRLHSAEFFDRWRKGKARKLSLFFVPHRSLHAVSGTISQVLRMHGPNFGAGGGYEALSEGLITAVTLMQLGQLPGLWIVLTQNHPEPEPDDEGNNRLDSTCYGIALAVRAESEQARLRLAIAPSEAPSDTVDDPFLRLFAFLEQGDDAGRYGSWTLSLDWGYELRITDA